MHPNEHTRVSIVFYYVERYDNRVGMSRRLYILATSPTSLRWAVLRSVVQGW